MKTIRTIKLGSIDVDIVQKDIKNIHLSVNPPHGKVRISAPHQTNLDTLRVFAISKLNWIKQQQRKLQTQERESPREYINRESHYIWGKRYLLEIIEKAQKPQVQLKHKTILLQVRAGANQTKKLKVLENFYRQQLKKAIPPLIAKWEKKMGVKVAGFTIRKMKTKWGSCSPNARTIRINIELAKKPSKFLEYVIIHEMTHLLEPTHNEHFIHRMNTFLPNWRSYREDLNRCPTKHEEWGINKNQNWKLD